MPKAPFDPKQLKAEIETLTVDQGPLLGEPVRVLGWQYRVLKEVAAHRETALTVPRSNGKSTFVAALACSAITPGKALFVKRGQVILVASSMSQARDTIFSHILEFMRPVLYDERDGELKLRRGEWRLTDNSHHMQLVHRATGTMLKVIGSDPKRAHGLQPHLIVADEPAQWDAGGDMMYAALRTSLGKQLNPRMLVIGTRPRSPLHFFSRLLASPPDGTASIVYSATPKDLEDGGAYKVSTIKKANPSYNHLEALRVELNDFKVAAKKFGGMHRKQYLALYLNMGTSESDAAEDVIDLDAWDVVTKMPMPERAGPVAIGIDLGGGNSLTAMSLYWPQTGRLEAHVAIPASPSLEERGLTDGIGTAYEEMMEAGVLHIHGVKETKNSEFLGIRLADVLGFVWLGVACDRFKIEAVKQALIDAGHDEDLIVDRATGRGPDGWGDLESFRGAVLEEHLRPGINLALEQAVMGALVRRDNNGNASLDKTHQKGRIDALQSTIHAVGLGERHRRPTAKPRQFDVDTFFVTR